MRTRKVFNYVEVCAAPGGLSLGFEMAGFCPLVAVDIDEYGLETLSYNFPNTIVLNENINTLKGKKILDEIGLSKGEIDVLGGGPPCQGFSNVGRVKIASLVRKGIWTLENGNSRLIDDPRNLLYREFIRLVKECAPKFFVMENVHGMISYKNGELVAEIKKKFEDLEYTVNYGILDAADFGVPQHRKRIFFMGNRLKVPIKFGGRVHGNRETKNYITVWSAIGDLPRLKAGCGREIMDYSRPTFSDYQKYARARSSHVFNHVARPHKERDIETFKHMRPGDTWEDLSPEDRAQYGYRNDIFHDKFKRLLRNRPSWTVTAHLCKDGYVYIHPTQQRTITVREAARLQSFPDKFVFRGPRSSQFRQVGNAVPPLLAKNIALKIRKVLSFYSSSATQSVSQKKMIVALPSMVPASTNQSN